MKDFLKKLAMQRGALGTNPARDWLGLLAATFLLLVASVAWNAWYFSRLQHGAPAASLEDAAIEAYPAGLIEGIFAARATTSEAYRSVYPFIDPSR